MHDVRESFAAALRNPMSQLGSALALVSGVLIVILVAIDLLGFEANPYVGIITYLMMPVAFALGLALTVWGVLRERKRSPDAPFPVIDLNLRHTRRRLVSFVVLVCLCVVILATATSGGIHYMESNAFCGTVCHNVMSPEYTAFEQSPHASIQCVDCHVTPGAGGFIKAKLNGARQMVAATLGTYDRPIPTPIHGLPATDLTCAECHWPGKYHGVKPVMITRFAEDEANSQTKTILLMNVGGQEGGESRGIHWHTDPNIKIRYRSDDSRQQIHEVEMTLPDGAVKRYFSKNTNDEGKSQWHTMQCVDCHNRPAHVFHGSVQAVDLALERGQIANDLPYVRREALHAVERPYESHEEARREITAVIDGFYSDAYPELAIERRDDIDQAGRVLGDLYARNVFPSMKIDWGTYPNFARHDNGTSGCFRCHAGNHATESGETISVDCRVCHTIVAWDEASPQILELIRGRGAP